MLQFWSSRREAPTQLRPSDLGIMKDFEHFGIDCQNQAGAAHTFRIPPPRLFGEIVGQSKVSESVFLLCPDCKFVFTYAKQDVHRRLFRVPDEYSHNASPVCFVVEFLCGTQGCKFPLKVYLLAYRGEDKRAVLEQFRNVVFRITCREGHSPRFAFANLIRVDSIGPFAPFV